MTIFRHVTCFCQIKFDCSPKPKRQADGTDDDNLEDMNDLFILDFGKNFCIFYLKVSLEFHTPSSFLKFLQICTIILFLYFFLKVSEK